jgi:hypothetical protein
MNYFRTGSEDERQFAVTSLRQGRNQQQRRSSWGRCEPASKLGLPLGDSTCCFESFLELPVSKSNNLVAAGRIFPLSPAVSASRSPSNSMPARIWEDLILSSAILALVWGDWQAMPPLLDARGTDNGTRKWCHDWSIHRRFGSQITICPTAVMPMSSGTHPSLVTDRRCNQIRAKPWVLKWLPPSLTHEAKEAGEKKTLKVDLSVLSMDAGGRRTRDDTHGKGVPVFHRANLAM